MWLAGLLTFTGAAGAVYLTAHVPLPPAGPLAETTILTDVSGARLASIDSGEDRIPVPLRAVPSILVNAVLATEDRNFFEHGGIDPLGIARAAVADLRGRPLQGGSTITQQYVKQVYLTKERTLARKVREATLALKLERSLAKEEILERYLNTVYFGRGAYGVQAGSRAYFNKDVGELRLSEAAYLAGLIRSPESADADRHRDAATARRNRTLRAMREEGWISAANARSAEGEPIETVVLSRTEREPDIVGTDKGTQYFVEYVRAELVRRYGADTTYQGGLRVKTTLDLKLQSLAYDAVYGFLDEPKTDPAGALVSIDAEGRVVAMVGGRNFAESKVNYAVGQQGGGSGRQAGSTFKPFLLAAVVKNGYSVQSAFPAPAKIILPRANNGKDYPIDNYDEADFGESLNLIDATASSVNTVYVQAQEALGRQKVVDMAKELGVTSQLGAHPSTVLGTADVSVLEMAGAYSTFASRGVYVTPRVILEVRRADGTLLEADSAAEPKHVLTPEQADVVNHCLRQVVLRGSGTGAKLTSVQVAGKTGTAQEYSDAWFIGFTPKLTTAVWMGFPDGNDHRLVSVRGLPTVTGGSFPATIFRRFMQEATKDVRFQAVFPRVTRFKGKVLEPPDDVVLGTTTTTTTPQETTTTAASVTTTSAGPPATPPPAPTTAPGG